MRVLLLIIIVVTYRYHIVHSDDSCEINEDGLLNLAEIDINEYINGNIEEKTRIANIIDEQLHKIGMFRIKNHGLSADLMNTLYEYQKEFFDQSNEFKSMYDTNNVLGANGWQPIGRLNVGSAYNRPNSKKDSVESLQFWYIQLLNSEKNQINKYCPEQLFNTLLLYAQKARNIISVLYEIFTLGLNLNTNRFAIDMTDINDPNITDYYFNQFALWNYPSDDKYSTDEYSDEYRLAEHADWSMVTILRNDNVEGLQTKLERIDNKWYTINSQNISDDSLVINLGEAMEMYTSGYWLSNTHKVIPLSPERRMSVAYFVGPNMNRIVNEMDECVKCKENRDNKIMERYNLPMKFKQHVIQRFGASFSHNDKAPFWL